MKKLLKAVTIGDIKGIGIEILIKLWKTKKKNIGNFILITNYKLLLKYLNKRNINLPICQIFDFNDVQRLGYKNFLVYNIEAINNNYNTYNSMLHAYTLTKKKRCSSIITDGRVPKGYRKSFSKRGPGRNF